MSEHALPAPAQWQRFLDEREHGRTAALLAAWGAFAAEWRDKYNACWDRYRSEVRYDALKSAALKALNYIENTENELGIKLSCGDALREGLR